MTRWYPEPDPPAMAAAVRAHFRRLHGYPPDGVWAAPGRVNVIGEHVDYNAGLCLPFALPHRTYVALARRTDGMIGLESVQRPGHSWRGRLERLDPGSVHGWAAYAAGVPWALRADGLDVPGFEAVVDGQVPLGSGLSSSAALECALAVALDDVAALGLGADDAGRARLAAACVRAENEVAGAPTGGLDQAAALRTRAGWALLVDCRDFSVTPVPFDLAAAGLQLLVMDTRAHHALVDGQYGDRRQECDAAARALGVATLREVTPEALAGALEQLGGPGGDAGPGPLGRRVRHVVTEIARVRTVLDLARNGDLRAIGPQLDASHSSLRDDFEVSCSELDLACEVARGSGALGARMVGGGFGGSAIALVEAGSVHRVADAVDAAFTAAGFDPPAFLVGIPSGPAGRQEA